MGATTQKQGAKGAGGGAKGSAAKGAAAKGAGAGGRAASSGRAAALKRIGKRSLAMDAAAPRADLQKLVDDVKRESRQRMRDKWGFDIESEQPVGGSKYTQLKP